MKNIGMIGGIGPEATMEYYTYFFDKIRERLNVENDYSKVPNIIIYSLGRDKFHGDGFSKPNKPARILSVIEKLHAAGADFVIGACNSLHIVYDQIVDKLPIPWITIMDATAEAIKQDNMNKIGLLGNYISMTDGFYHRALDQHGIETITPDEDDMREIDRIISEELVWNKMLDKSRNFLLDCSQKLMEQGAQGIILGCTELPLIVKQENTPIPVFPTTTLLAQKALDLAWEE